MVISSKGRLCLFVRIRESEIGRNESLFNFIARRVVLEKKMKKDMTITFQQTVQVDNVIVRVKCHHIGS